MSLRIALACDAASTYEPWVTRLADRILDVSGIELVGIIRRPETGPTMSTIHKFWWALERKAVAQPIETATPHWDKAKNPLVHLDVSSRQGIRDLEADLIIDVGTGFGADLPADLVKHGIWFLDFLTPATGAESVRAIADNLPHYEVSLCQHTQTTGAATLVAKAVLNSKLFASLNHLFLCEKSVTLVMRELTRLQIDGAVRSGATVTTPRPDKPGLLAFMKYGFSLLRRATKRFIEVQASKLHFRPGEFFLKTSRTDMLSVNPANMDEHHSTANGYFADPFLWDHDGEMYCFFEVYNYGKDTGHIAVGRLEDGNLVDIKPAIQADYHMSFPFLFQDDEGTLFMMPEVCSQRRIETWKCVEFPHHWERVQTVLDDVIAADSSLAKIDQDWWLFTNMSSDPYGEMSSELHLYKVDGPGLNTLTPHPLNPVVFDTRVARNGGRVIHSNGDYFRISQDNSHGLYGYGVNAMKIDHISMEGYEEELVRKIEPDFQTGVIGSHHMDSRAGMVVMDVRKQIGGFRLRSSEKPQKSARHSF